MKQLIAAANFAAEKHRNQRRKDADHTPYINHPLALAHVLAVEAGIADEEVVCAALLHDTLEDTDTSPEEIRALFGQRVLGYVLEVTDDRTLPQSERKRLQIEHAPRLSHGAKLIKLADKICNLRDLVSSPPAGWSVQRQVEYFDWGKQVVDGMLGCCPVMEKMFAQAYAARPKAPGCEDLPGIGQPVSWPVPRSSVAQAGFLAVVRP